MASRYWYCDFGEIWEVRHINADILMQIYGGSSCNISKAMDILLAKVVE